MLEKLKSKVFLRIFAIVSGLALVSFMVFPMLDMFKGNKSSTQTTSKVSGQAQQLKQIAQGYEEVLKREPNNVSALQGLAEARLGLQDFPGAIEPVKKLHTIDPANLQYIGVLTQLYQKINDISGAAELQPKVEKLAQSDPKNPQYLIILTQLYRQTNNVSGSKNLEKQVEKLAQSDPENPQYLQILAQLHLQTNDLPGALEVMKKLQKFYPDDEKLKLAISQIQQATAQKNQPLPVPVPSSSPQSNPVIPAPLPGESPQNNPLIPNQNNQN
ncbi:tetratricopeptide repeat protein [Gloeothece verrucosa]|uniref:Uncharacterized protein n=1 Tax=Gloeothece verrucosa (strain PCC 7822) TaxID=497965 RepID=E0UHY0_GLOV7|nr:tetratricopeptide repeat protein [Gloeothece verrucosa]ADN14510.1 hypothetical protein Cyan7822_2538 [Gloeothece verrucosa PCC 7822]